VRFEAIAAKAQSNDEISENSVAALVKKGLRSFLANEGETLMAIIIRIAVNFHEDRMHTMREVPDTGDFLQQVLIDDIVRGMKSNKRRKKIVT